MKRGREQFFKYRKYIMFISKIFSVFPKKIQLFFFYFCRNINGKLGIILRYVLLKSIAYKCGDNVAIYPGAYILNPQFLSIGTNVSIHPMCYLECGKKPEDIKIEDDVSIAHGVTIMSTTHTYNKRNINIKDQEIKSKPVLIKSNVWIGAKVTILSGVIIESGCVIGANSVVTKNTEKNGVYVGAPVKKIKIR